MLSFQWTKKITNHSVRETLVQSLELKQCAALVTRSCMQPSHDYSTPPERRSWKVICMLSACGHAARPVPASANSTVVSESQIHDSTLVIRCWFFFFGPLTVGINLQCRSMAWNIEFPPVFCCVSRRCSRVKRSLEMFVITFTTGYFEARKSSFNSVLTSVKSNPFLFFSSFFFYVLTTIRYACNNNNNDNKKERKKTEKRKGSILTLFRTELNEDFLASK